MSNETDTWRQYRPPTLALACWHKMAGGFLRILGITAFPSPSVPLGVHAGRYIRSQTKKVILTEETVAGRRENGAPLRVPKALMERFEALAGATDSVCKGKLTEEYAELARRAIAALCRKRPSPLAAGRLNSWACGVLYALGQINFLFDPSSRPHLTAQELATAFGLSASTAAAKARTVREALCMGPFDHQWVLPSKAAGNPGIWMVAINGWPADVRDMPRAAQIAAFEKGLIPYIPADGPSYDPDAREAILERYDGYRLISVQHQVKAAERLRKGPVAEAAVALGIAKTRKEAASLGLSMLAPAADLVLYSTGLGSQNAMSCYLDECAGEFSGGEQMVLEAMSAAVFSIFRVTGLHQGAGVDMLDLLSGEEIWLVDRGIDLSGMTGMEFAARLFQPEDFWMTTGVTTQLGSDMWLELEHIGASRKQNKLPAAAFDRNRLAEAVYRASVR